MGLTEYLLAGTANREWNASRDVILTRDGTHKWETGGEREKSISVSFVLSCLHMAPWLGFSFSVRWARFNPSPLFLSSSPDSSALTTSPLFYTYSYLPAPHSNTCSPLCFSTISPSLLLWPPLFLSSSPFLSPVLFSLTSTFHCRFLPVFISFDLHSSTVIFFYQHN